MLLKLGNESGVVVYMLALLHIIGSFLCDFLNVTIIMIVALPLLLSATKLH